MSQITIKEIAMLAGVSIGTVDRVLHNRGNVKPEKRERVLEICRRENYQPNILARAMKMHGRARKVAVIVNNPSRNLFSTEVKAGLDKVLSEWKDYNITFDYYDLNLETEEEQLAHLDAICERMDAYDGLILKPINSAEVCRRLKEMERKIPIIAITTSIDQYQPLCFVGQDHFKEGRMAANMLLKCKPDVREVVILSLRHSILSRAQKTEGFAQYLKSRDNEITLHGAFEYGGRPEDIFSLTREMLRMFPGADALYAHTRHLDMVNRAIEELGKEKDMVVFSFGTRTEMRNHLLKGNITFAIEEIPYDHGYLAGKEMVNYLLCGQKPLQREHHVASYILIEESV